jgi:hypothetical protein
MTDDCMKYFRAAKELNEEYEKDLKVKKLHFRGNRGSFSLISLDLMIPEQGKGGFTEKGHGRKYLENKIDTLLARKKKRVELDLSRPTPEKVLQAWIIDRAINHEYQLPFSEGLTFLTSELAFNAPEKIVNDILAIDQQGRLVVIELKSSRNKSILEEQIQCFCNIIDGNKEFFQSLVPVLTSHRTWHGGIRKMIVWPDAKNGQPRSDWNEGIEEIRYESIADGKINFKFYL